MWTSITYFGTWSAVNYRVNTRHFRIFDKTQSLFVDTGHGTSLAQKILREELPQPSHLFMTHCHSYDILGIAHLLRIVKTPLRIFCTPSLENKIMQLMEIIGKGSYMADLLKKNMVSFVPLTPNQIHAIGDRSLQPINLHSPKDEQYGFLLTIGDKRLLFFGDENMNVLKRTDLTTYQGIDRLLCEAFCTAERAEARRPYEKAHITAQDAGNIATKLAAKRLIISHIADELYIARSKQLLQIKKDAAQTFGGSITVPAEEQTIRL